MLPSIWCLRIPDDFSGLNVSELPITIWSIFTFNGLQPMSSWAWLIGFSRASIFSCQCKVQESVWNTSKVHRIVPFSYFHYMVTKSFFATWFQEAKASVCSQRLHAVTGLARIHARTTMETVPVPSFSRLFLVEKWLSDLGILWVCMACACLRDMLSYRCFDVLLFRGSFWNREEWWATWVLGLVQCEVRPLRFRWMRLGLWSSTNTGDP